MSGLDLGQFKHLVVAPTLALMGGSMDSPTALNLLAGTALAESGLVYVQQIGGGPARSLMQMEQVTHDDIWYNYLRFYPVLAATMRSLQIPYQSSWDQMYSNMAYAVAMARIKYWRSKFELPAADDASGLANYHATVYNAGGKANPQTNTPLFQHAIDA